jgi:hypothetical protein
MLAKPNLTKLLFRYDEELRNKMDELNRWEFEYIDDWSFDQDDGRLILSRRDGAQFICPAQIVGSHNTDRGAWMWAWANPTIKDTLKDDSRKVQEYGQQHGFKDLTKPMVKEYEDGARQFAALAAHLTDAWGVYRGMADPSKASWLSNALLPNDSSSDDEPEAPDVYFTVRDVVMRHRDGSEYPLDFRPDPVYGPDDGEEINDPEIARVVREYTAALAEWSKRCFDRDELVRRDEMPSEKFCDVARNERREIFERFCSPSRGRVLTKISYSSGDEPEDVVRMTRYRDGTVTAITKPGGSSDLMAYRLLLENGGYRIYRKYDLYSDGGRKSHISDQDL